jgi:ubiquinone biosynthesis protein UbiJ
MTDLLAFTAVAYYLLHIALVTQRLDDIAALAANVRRLRERLAKLEGGE